MPTFGSTSRFGKKPKFGSHRPFFKKSAFGVTRIVRDTYTDKWFTINAEVRARDGGKCQHRLSNGSLCLSTDRCQVHHIKPLSKGGVTRKSNLITLCYQHHKKRHKHMHD